MKTHLYCGRAEDGKSNAVVRNLVAGGEGDVPIAKLEPNPDGPPRDAHHVPKDLRNGMGVVPEGICPHFHVARHQDADRHQDPESDCGQERMRLQGHQ